MNETIAKVLLHKLFRHGYIEAKHMHKEVMKTAEKLTKKGLLTLKPTSYGIHVSLNLHRIAEIEQKIRDP